LIKLAAQIAIQINYSEIMTHKAKVNCLKCSLVVHLLLICLFATAQQTFNKVDVWLDNNLKSLGNRAVLVLYKDGKVIYSKAANDMSSKQKRVAKLIARKRGADSEGAVQDFATDTRQRIASCSKWLSAALVMSFVDEGKLKLEDTVGTYLPVMTAHGKGHIAILQCLSHLTAIKDVFLKESSLVTSELPDMGAAVQKIAMLPMEGEPGKVFHYSNMGLQLAAAVIEKISGKDFETLFQERIAGPCGMTNSDYGNGKLPLAAGGARSTPQDYIQFLAMILNNGLYNGKQVLSAQSVAAMQYNYAADAKVAYSPAEAGNWGYGLGEWVMDGAKGRSQAVSSPGLFGSFPWVDNKLGYAGFLFTMNMNSKGRHERYKDLKRLVDEVLR
jgi:CubicO group peptidase (beta-lactamase class C family)